MDPITLLAEMHKTLRADLKHEIELLRDDIQSWKDDVEELKSFKLKFTGMISLAFVFVEIAVRAAESYLGRH